MANLFVTQTYEGQSDIHSKSLPTFYTRERLTEIIRSDTWESYHGYPSVCLNWPSICIENNDCPRDNHFVRFMLRFSVAKT